MPERSWDIQCKDYLNCSFSKSGVEMCLSAPGIYNIKNILSHSCKQCSISFLVQPGRSPGIEMCLSALGIYNINNILSHTCKQCCISFLVQSGRSPGIQM